MARQLADRGHHVFAAVRNPSRAADPSDVEKIEVSHHSSLESVNNLVADLKGRLLEGKLDIRIKYAGFGATSPLIEVDLSTAKRLYDVSVLDLLAVAQAFAPMLIKAKRKMVNINSVGDLNDAMERFGLRVEKTNIRLIHSAHSGLYHSSKTASTIPNKTLSLELAPVDVTVITGMLGKIESNLHVNDFWQGLSRSSTYNQIESQIAKTAEGEIGPKKEKAEDFARRFVDDILRGASGQVWRGAMAQTVRATGNHAPMKVLDGLLLPSSGWNAMAKAPQKSKHGS
ncbi:hypothetical protein IMSHALPRED_003072 [Imshaugia aleurites]|uniref:NAD(P)-binding domain-containing protein n=1 Tax=Imshaugia aleurites TaxID=172621 RepID=A0A8H3J7H9_9LECA|nr:hypothetical protein IMSHALPRED_003072 [Imshaugia aleurites]